MVTERKALRTYALAYIKTPGTPSYEEQRRSLERWLAVNSVKLEDWYIDRGRRKNVHALLDRLRTAPMQIDYVLVYSPDRISKATKRVREFQAECAKCGARVVYTSRLALT